MSPARKAFFWVFFILLAFGLAIGLIKLVAPEIATVTLNDRDMSGWPAVGTATGIGAFLGLFFGLIVAGIVAVVGRRKT